MKFMKKFLLMLAAAICLHAAAFAVPKGRYDAKDGTYVLVADASIFLFIGGYSAGSFSILKENADGSFTFSDSGREVHRGRWYEQDGRIYLNLANRTLVKSE